MNDLAPRQERIIGRFRERCEADGRVVAALMYGSFPKGEGDRYSDVDFYLFLEDGELDRFNRRDWVETIAPVLAMFGNEFGTRVVIFDDLVRGEFHFENYSSIARVSTWSSPDRPGDRSRMLLLDRRGELAPLLNGVTRAPVTSSLVQERYDWLLNWWLLGWSVLLRGELARALHVLSWIHPNLLQLARVHEGNVDHWLTPSRSLEKELSTVALARLRLCSADLSELSLRNAYLEAWTWSRELVNQLAPHFDLESWDAAAASIERELLGWERPARRQM